MCACVCVLNGYSVSKVEFKLKSKLPLLTCCAALDGAWPIYVTCFKEYTAWTNSQTTFKFPLGLELRMRLRRRLRQPLILVLARRNDQSVNYTISLLPLAALFLGKLFIIERCLKVKSSSTSSTVITRQRKNECIHPASHVFVLVCACMCVSVKLEKCAEI